MTKKLATLEMLVGLQVMIDRGDIGGIQEGLYLLAEVLGYPVDYIRDCARKDAGNLNAEMPLTEVRG